MGLVFRIYFLVVITVQFSECHDGIWSASGGERIIVFTTNHVDKLDSALMRSGRMDKHIELSYCRFEAIKIFAKNYLDIDSHPLYGKISQLLVETNITPAYVVENLTRTTVRSDADSCLETLIQYLETAKEQAKRKANKALETAKEQAKQKGNKPLETAEKEVNHESKKAPETAIKETKQESKKALTTAKEEMKQNVKNEAKNNVVSFIVRKDSNENNW